LAHLNPEIVLIDAYLPDKKNWLFLVKTWLTESLTLNMHFSPFLCFRPKWKNPQN